MVSNLQGFIFFLAACITFSTGCEHPAIGKPAVSGPKPILVIDPKPGTYAAFFVDVTVSTQRAGDVLYYGLDEHPDRAHPFSDDLHIRLNRSTRVRVEVRDANGKLWGPYSFTYILDRPQASAYCTITLDTERTYFRPNESIPLRVGYAFPNELSQLNLVVDGKQRKITDAMSVAAHGERAVDESSLTVEGRHEISCEVAGPSSYAPPQGVMVEIDGTPPVASWISAGGVFNHDTWPFRFSVLAQDARSGIASVNLCRSNIEHCLDMETVSDNVYYYDTALTGETAFSVALTARILDHAGNQANIPALTINTLPFGEAPPQAPVPITVVTENEISLIARLGAHGRPSAVDVVKSSNLGAEYSPAALPLAPGWNDFLYRQGGRLEWESFSIYRAGLSVTVPASATPWLVYASESTVPGLQGVRQTTLPAGPEGNWFSPWLDVPHVWFVADNNANGRWDDNDAVWANSNDVYDQRFQSVLAPVVANLTKVGGQTNPVSELKTVRCAACGQPGLLIAEHRAAPYGFPQSHSTFPSALFSAGATETTVMVWTDSAGHCTFFWDENTDGALNRQEPRAEGACADLSFDLGSSELLTAAILGQTLTVTGVPYGGSVTGELQVRSGNLVFLRDATYVWQDTDGRGRITAQIDRPRNLPYRMVIYGGGASAEAELAAETSLAQTVALSVKDETGTATEAVVLLRGDAASNGGVYKPGEGPLSVARPEAASQLWVMAQREGYLSVVGPVTGESMQVPLLSPGVTGQISGWVVDSFGVPVSGAMVSWTAGYYESNGHALSDGWFSLPASGGTGQLTVSADGPYWRNASIELEVETGGAVQQIVVLPDAAGPVWPLGVNAGMFNPARLVGDFTAPAYVNATRYVARVTAGTFAVENVYGSRREVSMPGALPSLLFPGISPFLPPNSAALALLDSYAACGARSQPKVGFSGAWIDSRCWGWHAGDEFQTYFLGRLDPVTGFPTHDSFGMLSLAVMGAASVSVDLNDLLLGRTLRLPVRNGMVRAAVPNGLYAVSKTGGAAASDSSGEPAVVAVRPIDGPLVTIYLP